MVVNNFFARFGCPSQVHTDQGSNFTSAFFRSICDLLEITKTHTTPYRPCSNGQVERYNRTLLQVIRCYLDGKIADWDKDLGIFTGAIRSLPNRQTGFTPNMLMLGREVAQSTDLMFVSDVSRLEQVEPQFLMDLRARLHRVHSLARKMIGASQEYQKKYYDQNERYHSYEVGDVVLKLNKMTKTGQPAKLQPVWNGPLIVTEAISPILFRICGRRKSSVIHHDMIKPCYDRSLPMWLRRLRSQLLNQEDPEDLQVDTSSSAQLDSDPASADDMGVASLFNADPLPGNTSASQEGLEESYLGPVRVRGLRKMEIHSQEGGVGL